MTLISGERETVHLFKVDLLEDDLWSFVTEDPETGDFPLQAALGVDTLDESQVEGAVTEDLIGIGLAGFMTEGIGVDEDLIAGDRARIDALEGSVVIVKGAAFDGAQVPLTPQPPLTHVGTWHMTRAATTMEQLESPSATGSLPPAASTSPPPPSPGLNRRSMWLIVGITFLILLTLVVGAVL